MKLMKENPIKYKASFDELTRLLNFEGLALSGKQMALYRSTAIAVKVKIDTFTLTVWKKGQNAHMKWGRFHR